MSKRIGLLKSSETPDGAHEAFLLLLQPDQMYEAHVNLITHGRRVCRSPARVLGVPVAARCRYLDRRAP